MTDDIEAARLRLLRHIDVLSAEIEQLRGELERTRTNRDQIARSLNAVWDALGLHTAWDGNAMDAIRKLRTALDDARQAARRLVHMEREHLGTGPEGHLSERDLAPLLHALHIDPEETDRV